MQHLCKMEVAEMKCMRAIRGVTRRDKMMNEEMRRAGCWCGADERQGARKQIEVVRICEDDEMCEDDEGVRTVDSE